MNELEKWQKGWDALLKEAELRGRIYGSQTTCISVPDDLFARMQAYPPKPKESRDE